MAMKPRGSKFGGKRKKTPDTRVWHAPEAGHSQGPPREPRPERAERPPGRAPDRPPGRPSDRPPGRPDAGAKKPHPARRRRQDTDQAERPAANKPRWMQQIEEAKRRKSAGEEGQAVAREARKERRDATRRDDTGGPAPGLPPRAARPGMALPPPHKRLRNIRLVIEYDGSRYAGWQVQPNAVTVAGTIEKALAEVIAEDVRLVGAGRTDEGVHAEGQVANFLSHWKHPADGLVHGLNDRLPDDIAIIHAHDIGPEFHSRHSATARVYRYHVVRRKSVFMRKRALHVSRPMDLKLMRGAAEMIVGMHDFAAFADLRLHQDRSTKVSITYAGWKDVGGQLIFRIAGSHFLPRMVRRLVGCMVKVGLSDLPLETFKQWLETGQGESGPFTAPSMGLVLEHVEYPAEVLEEPAPARRERGVRLPRQERAGQVAAAPVVAAPAVAAPAVAAAVQVAESSPGWREAADEENRTHPVAQRAADALERGRPERPQRPERAPRRESPPAAPPAAPAPPAAKPKDENAIPRWTETER